MPLCVRSGEEREEGGGRFAQRTWGGEALCTDTLDWGEKITSKWNEMRQLSSCEEELMGR